MSVILSISMIFDIRISRAMALWSGNFVCVITLSHDTYNEYLVCVSRQTDSAINFLDPQTGATLRRFQKHDLCGSDIHISGDCRYLATTSDDASVRIWNLTKAKD